MMKLCAQPARIWSAVTCHRFCRLGDLSPRQGRLQRPGRVGRLPASDGDKSPAESADKSAHSRVAAASPGWVYSCRFVVAENHFRIQAALHPMPIEYSANTTQKGAHCLANPEICIETATLRGRKLRSASGGVRPAGPRSERQSHTDSDNNSLTRRDGQAHWIHRLLARTAGGPQAGRTG